MLLREEARLREASLSADVEHSPKTEISGGKKRNASARSLRKCPRGRCFGSVSWTFSERGGIRPIRVAESGDGLGRRGHWYWSLPVQPSAKVLNDPLRCSSQGMSTLGEDEHLRTPDPLQKRPDHDGLDIPAFLQRAPRGAAG